LSDDNDTANAAADPDPNASDSSGGSSGIQYSYSDYGTKRGTGQKENKNKDPGVDSNVGSDKDSDVEFTSVIGSGLSEQESSSDTDADESVAESRFVRERDRKSVVLSGNQVHVANESRAVGRNQNPVKGNCNGKSATAFSTSTSVAATATLLNNQDEEVDRESEYEADTEEDDIEAEVEVEPYLHTESSNAVKSDELLKDVLRIKTTETDFGIAASTNKVPNSVVLNAINDEPLRAFTLSDTPWDYDSDGVECINADAINGETNWDEVSKAFQATLNNKDAIKMKRLSKAQLANSSSALPIVDTLWLACGRGDLQTVKTFVKNGQDVNAADTKNMHDDDTTWIGSLFNAAAGATTGQTPLYLACVGGYPQVVDYLLSEGAKDENGECFAASNAEVKKIMEDRGFTSHGHVDDMTEEDKEKFETIKRRRAEMTRTHQTPDFPAAAPIKNKKERKDFFQRISSSFSDMKNKMLGKPTK